MIINSQQWKLLLLSLNSVGKIVLRFASATAAAAKSPL